MKNATKLFSAALLLSFGAAHAASSIPVTVSATVIEACSLGTDGTLVFAFGNVAAQSTAPTKTDTVSLTCSSGSSYKFSTTATGQSSDYFADVGTAVGAAKVSLTVSPQAAASPGPLPSTTQPSTTPVAISVARSGTGTEEILTFTAKLESVTTAGKAPTQTGAVAVSDSLYISYN